MHPVTDAIDQKSQALPQLVPLCGSPAIFATFEENRHWFCGLRALAAPGSGESYDFRGNRRSGRL
jgi:hypothetical protein